MPMIFHFCHKKKQHAPFLTRIVNQNQTSHWVNFYHLFKDSSPWPQNYFCSPEHPSLNEKGIFIVKLLSWASSLVLIVNQGQEFTSCRKPLLESSMQSGQQNIFKNSSSNPVGKKILILENKWKLLNWCKHSVLFLLSGLRYDYCII